MWDDVWPCVWRICVVWASNCNIFNFVQSICLKFFLIEFGLIRSAKSQSKHEIIPKFHDFLLKSEKIENFRIFEKCTFFKSSTSKNKFLDNEAVKSLSAALGRRYNLNLTGSNLNVNKCFLNVVVRCLISIMHFGHQFHGK